MLPSYENQSIDLWSKSIDWFPYNKQYNVNNNLHIMNRLLSMQWTIYDQCFKSVLPEIWFQLELK